MDALGFVEVDGFVSGVVAADAMLQSAQVRLLPWHNIRPGIITLVVEGDLAACRAAVGAGVAAAKAVGQVLSHHVIGRLDPDEKLAQLIFGGHTCVGSPSKPKPKPVPVAETPPSVLKKKPSPEKSQQTKSTPTDHAILDKVLAFIGTQTNGRTWSNIAKQFPNDKKVIRKQLDIWVSSGILQKKSTRYRVVKT